MNSSRWIAALTLSFFGFTMMHAAIGQSPNQVGEKLRVLIVDGVNPYHDWQATTALMKRFLEESGRFSVDVATVPPKVEMSQFHPRFADYDAVLCNYGEPDSRWPAETERDFAAYVEGGGGFVCIHAASIPFADWPEYNRICGLAGWGERNEKAGPYVYYTDADVLVRDESPGPAGHHGPEHEFQVRIRDAEHPIMRGLPALWMHTKDELYDSLRGPAEELHVLATAYSDPKLEGTGRHEPMLMTIHYGKGRVFHTVMGHADYSLRDVGFVTTLLRGTEWAATGDVTIGIPDDFPTADQSRSRTD